MLPDCPNLTPGCQGEVPEGCTPLPLANPVLPALIKDPIFESMRYWTKVQLPGSRHVRL